MAGVLYREKDGTLELAAQLHIGYEEKNGFYK